MPYFVMKIRAVLISVMCLVNDIKEKGKELGKWIVS